MTPQEFCGSVKHYKTMYIALVQGGKHFSWKLKPTTHKLERSLHIIMTAEFDWNPALYHNDNNDKNDIQKFYDGADDSIHH
jgi:hypothetical protein